MSTPSTSETPLCSVCGGTGEPVSGRPCICGGSGNVYDQVQNLTLRVFELEGLTEDLVTEMLRMLPLLPDVEQRNKLRGFIAYKCPWADTWS